MPATSSLIASAPASSSRAPAERNTSGGAGSGFMSAPHSSHRHAYAGGVDPVRTTTKPHAGHVWGWPITGR
jgi:hypothetical protein